MLALLSAPLVDPDRKDPISRLNLEASADTIRRGIEAAGKAVDLHFVIATSENLLASLRERGPFDLLHFDGHGTPGKLLFEDGRGGGHPIDFTRLAAMFAAEKRRSPATLAVLSACHSASVAEVFVEAGVKHVVAIDAEKTVLDLAARKFVGDLYPALLQQKTVREAFRYGRARVYADPEIIRVCERLRQDAPRERNIEELLKFRLLPEVAKEAEDGAEDPHAVQLFQTARAGETRTVDALGKHPESIVARPEFFTGRERELYEVISRVSDHKVTTVRGIGGMGKSELCREAGRWFAERGGFPGGITFVPLGALGGAEKKAQADDARLSIAAELKINPQEAATPEDLARRLPRDSLLILDELDHLVVDDLSETRRLIDALAGHGEAKLLISSRYRSGAGGEQTYPLTRLSPPASRELFLRLAPTENGGLRGTEEQLEKVLAFLDGVPRAIYQAAKQMITPDIRELLEDLRESREEILADPDIPEEERKDGDSVLVTLNSSYKRLRQLGAQAAEFFPLLALFPAGIGDEGLRQVFGRERARLIRPIVERALVETAPPFGYYYLPTPVRSYAERKLPEGVMDQVAPRALPYLAKRVEAYDALITEGKHASGILCFASELPNIELFFGWGYERESALEEPSICHSARGTAGLQNFFVTADPAKKQLWRYEKGLGAARRVGDQLAEARCLDAIGDVQRFRDENDEALASYRQALGLFRGIGDRLGEANCLKAIGDVQSFRQENDEALASYRQALGLFRGIGARLGEANCLKAIGDVQSFRQENDEALASYRQALGLFRGIGARLGEANCLKAIGDVQSFRQENDEALASYRQALGLFRGIGDRLGEANCLRAIGHVQSFRKENDEALASYRQALGLFRGIGDRLGEANCLKAIGHVQSFRQENDEALASYRQALGLFRGIGARLGEANCLKAIGDVQSFRKENDEALASYRQALGLFRGIGDRLGEANCLRAIGDVQAARGEGQEAFGSYREALGIYDHIGNRLGAANTLFALGKLLLRTQPEEKGVDLLNQALVIYQQIGDRAGQANVGIALARYQEGKGDLNKAIEHLQPVADFGKSIGHPLGEEHQTQIDAWRQALAKREGQAAAGDG